MIYKPINPSPYNCFVDVKSPLVIEYEIPNNQKINGRYISVNDMETGDSILESYENLNEPTNKVEWGAGNSLSEYNNNEYIWNSFYWQTPTKEPDKVWTVSNIDVQTGTIHLKPDGTPLKIIQPKYFRGNKIFDVYSIVDDMIRESNNSTYSQTLFNDCGHSLGDDTSYYCSGDSLEDLFGYPMFLTRVDLVSAIRNVGWGKCIMEVYDNDGKLVSRARCLGYDHYYGADFFDYYVIIDNKNFITQVQETFGKHSIASAFYTNATGELDHCIPYYQAHLYNIEDLNKQEGISGMIEYNNQYCYIEKCEYSELEYSYILSTRPAIPAITDIIKIGDTIDVWTRDSANFNISPTYYFRTKSSPVISVNANVLDVVNDTNILKDIKCKFGINYDSQHCGLNYFRLYLYVSNQKSHKWKLKEVSAMLYNTDDVFEFVGLANGQKYKIYGVCTDNDGDEWITEEIEFSVVNTPISSYGNLANFNKKTTTIDILLIDVLNQYNTAHLEFYKILKSDMNDIVDLTYAGYGLAKSDGVVFFNKWSDYNIKNDSYYDYFIRVVYIGKESDTDEGVDLFIVGRDVLTDFKGTSILGIEQSGNAVGITRHFNLFYNIQGSQMNELTNEISREYINTFSKYPKELKGHQNYLSGSCSGLLGSECNGLYEEPKAIRAAWNDFVNDDTIKLYRGVDGETMIISIDSNKIKPSYYSPVGIVNEVTISFKEIASTSSYTIFTTEKTGD